MESTLVQPRLTMISGSPESVFDLAGTPLFRIGRAEGNELVLRSELISRSHAIVQHLPGEQYLLSDMGSRNGTFVNGSRVTAHVLRDGDHVTIGEYQFVFSCARVDTSVPARAPEAPDERTVGFFSVRLATVLVADVRGFTGLSQRLGPEMTARFIGTLSGRCGKYLQQQGAWAQKYIGDAVMAIWLHAGNEPTVEEARRVLECAAWISEEVESLPGDLGLPQAVSCSVGISTGFASLGNLGNEAFADHTAVGDTVNLAFRLEAATRVLQCDVAVSSAAYEFLRKLGLARGYRAKDVALKGYDQPQSAYCICYDELRRSLGITSRFAPLS